LSERKDRGVKESAFLQKKRAHTTCGFDFPQSSSRSLLGCCERGYKSNITVIKLKRESGQHEEHKVDVHVGRTRRDIKTHALRIAIR
jgi:hypothetical protein